MTKKDTSFHPSPGSNTYTSPRPSSSNVSPSPSRTAQRHSVTFAESDNRFVAFASFLQDDEDDNDTTAIQSHMLRINHHNQRQDDPESETPWSWRLQLPLTWNPIRRAGIKIPLNLADTKFLIYETIWGIYRAKFSSETTLSTVIYRSHNIHQINYVESPRYHGKPSMNFTEAGWFLLPWHPTVENISLAMRLFWQEGIRIS